MQQMHGLRIDVLCRAKLISFSFEISKQYDVRIVEQLPLTLQPVPLGNLERNIFSISDIIIDTASLRFYIVGSLQLVGDVIGNHPHASTTADVESSYK